MNVSRCLHVPLCVFLGALPVLAQGGPGPRSAPSGPGSLQEPTRIPILNRVTGVAWHDVDGDGLQGLGEPGLAGVRVKLLDTYGKPRGPAVVTASDGSYAFQGMSDGEYRVAFVRPDGYRFTDSDVGAKDLGGQTITADARSDDSDLNLANGYLDPTRRGPWETGMSYLELTRIDGLGRPWPINAWAIYPAAAGASALPRTRVRDLYLDDMVDLGNSVAASKFATSAVLGQDPNEVTQSDPNSLVLDFEARSGALPADDGPFPVVLLVSGLISGAADLTELGDWLASHGYVALCMDTVAHHASIALGDRLSANGGPWEESDFDHVPQLSASAMVPLVGFGYVSAGHLMSNYSGSVANQRAILFNEASFLLNSARSWNAQPGHAFEGLFDLGQVGWIGYSAGAANSALAVDRDRRIDLLVNLDSANFVNVAKPMLWVGNHTGVATFGPTVQARLSGDFHPHWFLVPAIRFEPPWADGLYHREYHHEVRNTLITAFCGHWLKGVLRYRDDLGLDGARPRFDGYVTPYIQAKVPGWHTAPFTVADGATHELDAGLVDVRLWILDDDRLLSLPTDFLGSGTLSGAQVTDHGTIGVARAGGVTPLGAGASDLALDAQGRAWFLAGCPPVLHELDTHAIANGAAVVAQELGTVANLPANVTSLAFEPRSSRLFALDGAGTPRLWSFLATASPTALDHGPVAGGVASPLGLEFDVRGGLWVGDGATEALHRVAAGSGQNLDPVVLAGLHVGDSAYDARSKLLFVVDRTTGELFSFDPEAGTTSSYGSLVALGIDAEASLGIERDRTSPVVPVLVEVDAATSLPAGPMPILENAALTTPVEGWDGYLLRVQIVEATGTRADLLTLDTSGPVGLGARLTVELPDLSISEAYELIWNATHIGWLELDQDLAIGGLRLAPLRIAFTAQATAAAVADVLESLRYEGELPRRFELELANAAGDRSLAEVIELD